MKTLIVFAMVGLMAAIVTADSSEDNSRDNSRGVDGGRPGSRRSCVCRNQCVGNLGTINIGCRKTRTQYLQCVGAVCSNQTCPIDQLFNYTSGACEVCPEGLHVDATRQHCVCNNGTTPNFKTRTCVPCPKDSIQTADKCYCNSTTVLNKAANACEVCPVNSVKSKKECRCTVAKQFWNEEAFKCQPCPGTWVTKTKKERKHVETREVCQCPTATDVFNEDTVSCAPCPANSTFVPGTFSNSCKCIFAAQKYDDDTNTCVDRYRLDIDDSSHFF